MTNSKEAGRVIYRVIGGLRGYKRDVPCVKYFRLYDVYQDGSFHYFDFRTGKPSQEPKEWIEDRKRIENELNPFNVPGGVSGFNRASRDEYQKAFTTLCKLGFGPQNNSEWGRTRDGIVKPRVEYLGEDEPWIDVNEYNERHGLPRVVYD